MYYQKLISERLAEIGRVGVDPRHVEAYLLLDHGTMDVACHSPHFAQSVREIADLALAYPADAESLAKSYGL